MKRSSVRAFVALVTLFCFACSGKEPAAPERIRPAYFAQQGWYPKDGKKLGAMVDGMLAEAPASGPGGRMCALVSPHAGLRYSGNVAAHGYRLVPKDRFDRVILIGVAHRVRVQGASVPNADAYRTPLGLVRVDRKICNSLLKQRLISNVPDVHRTEHSLEMQLPFLQRRLKSFRLIPLAVGEVDDAACREIAQALKPSVTDRTLIVASCDFTHYGRSFRYVPFQEDVQANLAKLDRRAFGLIVRRDSPGFSKFLTETGDTICGRSAVKVLLHLLSRDAAGKLLKYDTSGRMTGGWEHSVSYGSIAFYVPAKSGAIKGMKSEGRLTDAEKAALMRLARAALSDWVKSKREPDLKALKISLTAAMKERRGAFVTLKVGERLRGCIGYIAPREPLYRTVIENAKNASTRDWRFRPVKADELPKISIEISALTVPTEIDTADKFVVGRHGIIIRKGRRSAVFLPQVAPEQGWDRATTLAHLCRKAGLASDAWRKPGMKFLVFEAEVFHE